MGKDDEGKGLHVVFYIFFQKMDMGFILHNGVIKGVIFHFCFAPPVFFPGIERNSPVRLLAVTENASGIIFAFDHKQTFFGDI